MKFVLAPLSNDHARDWPLENYRNLVALILTRAPDSEVMLLGAALQRPQLNEISRSFPSDRVINTAGRYSWRRSSELIGQAAVVVANNSGIAHVAAGLGAPLICIFCASHDPGEWMPVGPRVTVLYSHPACAPCCRHGFHGCPINKRCLRVITPEIVCSEIYALCSTAGTWIGERNDTLASASL
jgi:ADP-heptose:LPS heptosyltransferase